ncbi:hypothetical protein AB0K52_17300 [Glycomyces sp. NPDC049804]|uniref:hypothetical protein n=1 Tax=Glycomyces sp. NPDC049804 TaxID=3154363 RepID=UPI003419EB7C
MSDDIEALLRSGMAERADAAPTFDDPGLADLAIAGAGRIRRRRRVAGAAGGAGLLVLGAAAFVWNPWIGFGEGDGDQMAADTTTIEVQDEFAMEFVVYEDDAYHVFNEDGDTVPLDVDEPTGDVYKLATAYLWETDTEVWTGSFDGQSATTVERPSAETSIDVNGAGDQYLMYTPNEDYSMANYEVTNLSSPDLSETATFTTRATMTLEDWDARTVVFTYDLHSSAAGEAGEWYFNEQYELGLEEVSAAGFESAVLVDTTDPNFVCVSDLDAAGSASGREQCGPLDDEEIQAQIDFASGKKADAVPLVQGVAESYSFDTMMEVPEIDLGEYEGAYNNASYIWSDPKGEWELAGNPGDETWILIDSSGEQPVVSELEVPEGAVQPVLSYT